MGISLRAIHTAMVVELEMEMALVGDDGYKEQEAGGAPSPLVHTSKELASKTMLLSDDSEQRSRVMVFGRGLGVNRTMPGRQRLTTDGGGDERGGALIRSESHQKSAGVWLLLYTIVPGPIRNRSLFWGYSLCIADFWRI